MMTERNRRLTLACVLVGTTLICTGGCVSLAANLLHAIHGNNRPAEYEGLVGKRVAVVCSTESGLGSDAASAMLTNYIHAALNSNVDEIEMVRQSEVERWLDSHGRSDADYLEIGKGVEAERLLAVEVLNLSLKNGATLYRGQSDIRVTVYDIDRKGAIVFEKDLLEFAYPQLGGAMTTDTTESKFRARYLTIIARTVSSLFYEVDATADFALDAIANSF